MIASYYCLAHERLIGLDVEQGRYFAVRSADQLISGSGGLSHPALLPPEDDAVSVEDPVAARLRDILLALVSVSVARAAVRILSFGRLMQWMASLGSDTHPAPPDCLHQMRRYRQARRYGPPDRPCLPEAVAALLFLAWKGHRADLVIGVTGKPFSAHCWVQLGTLVLSEPLDAVRRFTPILSTPCLRAI